MTESGIIKLKPIELIEVSAVGSFSETIGHTWKKLFEWLDGRQLHESPGLGYGLAYDRPQHNFSSQHIYSAAVRAPTSLHKDDENFVKRKKFDGGLYIFRRHRTPYQTIPSVIGAVRNEWVLQDDLMVDSSRPVVSFYFNDPRTTKAGNQYVDICLPIRRRGPASVRMTKNS